MTGRVRRRKAIRERQPEPTPEGRAAFALSAETMRERMRRLPGLDTNQPRQMTDAEYAEAEAWRDRFHAEQFAAWHAAHPEGR